MNEEADGQNDGSSNLEQLDDGQSSLSSEKAALFERRFEEEYDLPDDEYMKWLRHAHPESVINKTGPAIQRDTLNHTGDDALLISEEFLDEESDLPNEEHVECVHETFSELRTAHSMSSSDCREKSPLSQADMFSDLPVASPLSIVTDELSTEVGHDVNAEASIEHEDSKSINENFITSEPELENESTGRNSLLLDGVNQIMENSKAPEEVFISERLLKGKTDHVVASSGKSKASVAENTERNDKLRYISKYLVQFVPDAKPKSKETAVRISGARVLMNDKCAAILKEREEKVKKQQEEKERKKLEREQKRKQSKRSKRKRRPLVQRERPWQLQGRQKRKQKKLKWVETKRENKVNRKRQHNDDGYETRNKLQKSAEDDLASTSIVTTDDVENVRICCVCFQLYLGEEENTDWIQCACGRWLHEDCIDIDDIIHDIHGRELFYPFCAV